MIIKYDMTKQKLEEYYINQQLSTNDIGRIYGCNNGTVWARLHKYGIPIRTNKVASTVGRPKSGRVKLLPIKEIVYLYTVTRMPSKMIGIRFGCSKWLVCDRLKKVGIAIRTREEALTDFGRATLWSPEIIKKRIEAEKKYWSGLDLERRNERLKQMALAAHRKPNVPEKIVLSLLDEYFPKEWLYVGDGSIVIDGLNPDFINVNGHKFIIELFGDYWHRKKVRKYHETELGRVEAYQKYGYNTLVIWENETKNTELVLAKITQFFYTGKQIAGGRRV